MNEIIEHVDTRSDPVEAGDETGRQGKEREREQNEKQIAHDTHRYFFEFPLNRADQYRSGLINA
ncbi:hypothetical protein [Burkholderia paludis]|uniref:hypothetical protein n=1 Tax=Burkholderia paludis TaxID=1506587 RepID=UPI00126A35F2|nr:hypothetical protein [Burkholderia paludis]